MAGSYPDAPSWRMPIDRDGTEWYDITPDNVVTQITQANIDKMHDEDDDLYSPANAFAKRFGKILLLFPELRDLDAVFAAASNGVSQDLAILMETSVDTTNGVDGTWLSYVASYTPPRLSKPNYRTGIIVQAANGVKALRVMHNEPNALSGSMHCLHVYGEPSAGQNPHRMALWHPTLDQRVGAAHFDWGNVPRSSSADKTFRVKNLSGTQTANTVSVSLHAHTDGSPSVPGQHTLSTDGTNFTASIAIGSLAPGAISGVLTLRRVTPSTAQLSLWTLRVIAEAASWT